MRHSTLLLCLILCVLMVLAGCKRENEPNKILHGTPVDTNQNISAIQAIQEFHVLTNDVLLGVVPVINRLGVGSSAFPELSGPDANTRFTLTVSKPRYGTATILIQFVDNSGSVIDPINAPSSTATLKTVRITGGGSSTLFQHTLTSQVELNTAGDVNSDKVYVGSHTVVDTGAFNLLFEVVSTGAKTNFEGLVGGFVTANGVDVNSAGVSGSLHYSTDHSADGPLIWNNTSGDFHINANGSLILVTPRSRLFFD